MIVSLEWAAFKTRVASSNAYIQYESLTKCYSCWIQEGNVVYKCKIVKDGGVDVTDFEDNYKTASNKPILVTDDEGRPFIRAESKPTDMTTYFTSKGDGAGIGDGVHLMFDFNNTDNDVASPPAGTKQKKVSCTFRDTVRLKEGTAYWENVPFGSTIDLCLGVEDWGSDPAKGWYLKNDGTPAQNKTGEQLNISKFVNDSPMMGSCPMGDEMNTEAASNNIPAGTIFGFLVTVPDTVSNTDNVHGVIVLELYRERTVVLE